MADMTPRGRKDGTAKGKGDANGAEKQTVKAAPPRPATEKPADSAAERKRKTAARVAKEAREELARDVHPTTTLVEQPVVPPAAPVNSAQVDLESPTATSVVSPAMPPSIYGSGNGKPTVELPTAELKLEMKQDAGNPPPAADRPPTPHAVARFLDPPKPKPANDSNQFDPKTLEVSKPSTLASPAAAPKKGAPPGRPPTANEAFTKPAVA